MFFLDKRFVAASILLSRQKDVFFVATKMILVAAPANDNFSDSVRGRCLKLCMLLTCINASHVLTSYGHLNPFTAMLAALEGWCIPRKTTNKSATLEIITALPLFA